jgi:HAMP domain-containing protein
MKKRRLIGPILFSLVLCGLIADQLYFKDSPWSVARQLGKIASVLAAIFATAFNPELYGWVSDFSVPMAVLGSAFVLLVLAIARAKNAMKRATPDPADAAPLHEQKVSTDTPPPIPLRSVPPAPSATRKIGLVGKLTFCFGVIGISFGAAACVIVHGYLSRVFEREVKSRADVMALGIHDITAGHLGAENLQDLGEQITRYASTNKMIAYIYVEDANGQIIAHDPKDLPIYLSRDFPRSAERALNGTDGQYRGFAVYEIAKRNGQGNGGFVHLGLWREAIDAESRRAVAPIAAAIIVLLIGAVCAFVFVAQSLSRPFVDLVDHAQRISKGEFAVPLELKRADEIGEIARSLERMRSSLRAVVTRLEKG